MFKLRIVYWKNGVDSESMLIGSKNEELRESMQPTKTMMQQFLIFEDGLVNISTLPTPIFQVFNGWHKCSHMERWYQLPLSTCENMLSWNEIKGEWYYFNQTGILLLNQCGKNGNRCFSI